MVVNSKGIFLRIILLIGMTYCQEFITLRCIFLLESDITVVIRKTATLNYALFASRRRGAKGNNS